MRTLHNCPICAGNHFSDYLECKDFFLTQEKFKLVQCNSCGFIFVNPQPEVQQLHKYYDSPEYVSHSGTEKGVVNKIYKKIRNHTHHQKYKLVSRYVLEKKILDIGCGSGELLALFKKNSWDILGVEPNENARKHAIHNLGLKVVDEGEIEKIPDHSFPAIMLWHVLEHVPELNRRMAELKRILKPEGALFMAVPHCSSYDAAYYKQYWAAYDVPRHLWHFTPETIKILCKKYNFKISKILPMKFDSYYVSMLSEKYKTGKQHIFKGFINGFISNQKAEDVNGKFSYSSQIYVIKNI